MSTFRQVNLEFQTNNMQIHVSDLPQEVVLYILDFLECYPLNRYFATNNITQKRDQAIVVDYPKLIRLLFGYFSNNYQKRKPFLLFPNIDMTRYFGIVPGEENTDIQCIIPIPITDDVIRKVVPWRYLKNLHVKNNEFRGAQLTSDAFQHLTASKNLRTIDFMSNKSIDNKIVPYLQNCSLLTKIVLSGTKVSSNGIKELLFGEDGTPRFPKLRTTMFNGLQGIAINDRGLEQIFSYGPLPNLVSFAAQRGAIEDDGAVALVSKHLPDLKIGNLLLNKLTTKFLANVVFPASLTSIDLGYSDFNAIGDDRVFRVFYDNKTLVRLGLMDCKLTDAPIRDFIANNSAVTYLDLSDNSGLTAECLSTLSSNKSLSRLDLGQNKGMFADQVKTATYLSQSESLQAIFMGDCALTDELCENLFRNRKTYPYRHLSLMNNPGLTARSIDLIAEHAPHLKKIKLKHIKMNGLQLAKALTKMKSLENALLINVGLTDEGATHLFRNIKNLISLDMSYNKFSDKALDAEIIATFMKNNPLLEKFYLQWNMLSDVVARDLFQAIIKEKTENPENLLYLLDLAGNRLTDACLGCLEPMNEVEQPLKYLYVGNNNRISQDGRQFLYDKASSIYHIFV
jgi:hypothetical protein